MCPADNSTSPTSGTSGPKADGSGAYNPAAGYLNAEARRSLASPAYSSSAPSTIDIPRDTVIKRMFLRLVMSVTGTYSSGSPLYDQKGAFERICSNVEININGNRVVKSVRPHMMRLHNILTSGALPRRAYATSATAFTVGRADAEWLAGTIAYPATTQYTLFNEGFELSFENPFGYGGSRHMSELDVRDVASATAKFYWQPATNLQSDATSPATVTYTNLSAVVTPQIIENRARPRPVAGQVLYDYVETSFSRSYTGQARSNQIDLQTGNYLMGIGILAQNGDSAYTLLETLLTNMALMINGANAIQGPVSHADLQDSNQIRFGADDKIGLAEYNATIASVAKVHPLRGFALMNLIRNGNWNTAINTSRQAGVDAVKLQFDTPSTSGTDAATYTNNLSVVVHSHEMRPFAYSR